MLNHYYLSSFDLFFDFARRKVSLESQRLRRLAKHLQVHIFKFTDNIGIRLHAILKVLLHLSQLTYHLQFQTVNILFWEHLRVFTVVLPELRWVRHLRGSQFEVKGSVLGISNHPSLFKLFKSFDNYLFNSILRHLRCLLLIKFSLQGPYPLLRISKCSFKSIFYFFTQILILPVFDLVEHIRHSNCAKYCDGGNVYWLHKQRLCVL